jgi:hypothetical protein
MINLHITRTSKGFNSKDDYSIFDDEVKTFDNLADAKSWLEEEYGTHKRSYMYEDDKDGNTKRIGYIYGLQQDWISFYKVNRTVLTV